VTRLRARHGNITTTVIVVIRIIKIRHIGAPTISAVATGPSDPPRQLWVAAKASKPAEIAAALDTEDLRHRFPLILSVPQLAELLQRSRKTIYC